MRKILFGLIFCNLLFAGTGTNTLRYVPGELIIKYVKDGHYARGNEVLSEHQNFVYQLVNKYKDIKVKTYSPLFHQVVDEMVRKSLTETEVINRFRSSTTHNSTLSLDNRITFSNVLKLNLDVSGDMQKLALELMNNKDVLSSTGYKILYVEPNYIKYIFTEPNDPLYSQQWAHKVTNIEKAWDTTQGDPNIKIAIIDTGVDPTHPDLIDNLLPGYDFVDINTDNYLNEGYSLLNGEDYTIPDNDCTDFNGHGTHCAGIAAAVGDNGIGVKGVAPGCKILPVRAGFSIITPTRQEMGILETSSIVQAINYAVNNGANIISMSFGGDSSYIEKEAIQDAYYNNVTLIAAAGNNNSTEKPFPAGYNEVLAITSIDTSRNRSSFSNYGLWTSLAAPGENIISTVPLTGGAFADPSGYKVLSGTSQAAPYAAGVAALILSHHPAYSNNLVFQELRSATIKNYISDYYIGTGIIDGKMVFSGKEACVSKITSPHNISSLYMSNGNIEIAGRASGKYFKSYYFEYSDYQNSTPIWIRIGSSYSNPVDSGYLGNININSPGIYYVRLVVISQENKTYTDLIGPITVDKRLRTNWPLSLKNGNICSPVLSDIDKDERIEVIYTSSDGKIYVVDRDGNNKPGWPVTLPESSDYKNIAGNISPAVADIDNDGKEEIVVKDGIKLYVYGYDGILKPGWPQNAGTGVYGNGQLSSPVIADINNDGKKEILITYPGQMNDLLSYGELIVYSSTGEILPGWPVQVPISSSSATLFCTPVVSDLNGDGNSEIILQCLDEPSSKGYLYVFDKNGTLLTGWPKEIGAGSYNSPIAADIDNDGKNEIIASAFVSNGPAGTLGSIGVFAFNPNGEIINGFPVLIYDWSYGYYSIGAGLSAGDINNDGFKEILVASSQGPNSLSAINKNGEVIWNAPTSESFEYNLFSEPLIADINNDGNVEILESKYNNINSTGKILVFNNKGNILNTQSFIIPQQIWSTPSIGYFEDKDKLELICSSVKGNIFCWDLDAKYDPAALIWPTYQQNYQRNGSIEILKKAPSAASLIRPADSVSNQPKTFTFSWNPVTGALNYHLQISDSSSFSKIIFEDSLITNPYVNVDSVISNKIGFIEGTKYFWRVSAGNSFGTGPYSVARSFIVLLTPPEKLTATAQWGYKIKLNWADKTDNEDGYIIERKLSSDTSYVEITTLPANTISYTDSSLNAINSFDYRVKAYNSIESSLYSNIATISTIMSTEDKSGKIPTQFELSQNYPNPFNPTTTIQYGLPKQSHIRIVVYNVLGQVVKELINSEQNAGYYSVDFGGNSISSGVYFYRIDAKSLDGTKQFREIKKMLLLK